MKNFFEFLGFVSTILITGFFVFSFIGHNKNADRSLKSNLLTESAEANSDAAPELPSISSTRKKGGDKAAKRNTAEAPELSETEKLRNLFDDEDFVQSAVRKWKKATLHAQEDYAVKPNLLLAHAIVQSYLGTYSERDLYRDAAAHGGDLVMSTDKAAKKYPYSWSVTKVNEQFDLKSYYPDVAVAGVSGAKSAPALSKSVSRPQASAKNTASVAPSESGFREMVAKEEGFSSWQGLQKLGDPDAKKRAAQRVKILMKTARIK